MSGGFRLQICLYSKSGAMAGVELFVANPYHSY